ncbi:MAG: tetratricopeptide repeat protein [Candidatus Heimdallarchaeota archaeon]|nr:MAG: tetratricopeptide repeat protein [Candidatus Heimdallarchaeota archaeon]
MVKEIDRVKKLLEKGKLNEALTKIDQLDKRTDLSNDDKIEILLLKSTIFMKLGEFELSNDILGEFLGKKNIDPLHTVDALIIKAENLDRQAEYDEGLEIVSEGEELLKQLTQIEQKEISKRQSILLRRKGGIYSMKGDLDSALNLTQQSLKLAREIKDQSLISGALNNIGIIFQEKGDNDNALDYFRQSLAIAQEIGKKYDLAFPLGNIGIIYRRKGDFTKALENFQQSLAIYQEIGDKRGISVLLFFIGETYAQKGELDDALDHYEQSIVPMEEIGDKFFLGNTLLGIGEVHRQRGDFTQANDYFKRSLVLFEEIGNNIHISENVLLLLLTAINNNSFSQAKNFLGRLQQINDLEDNLIVSQYFRLAHAIILKNSTRMSGKVKSQEILHDLVNEKSFSYQITFHAMLSLCELLVDELKLFGEEEVQKQVKSLLNRINVIAFEQHASPLIVQTLLLQAKFSLVEGNAQQANKLLDKARVTANESGLELLAVNVSNEQENLYRELDKWKELFHRNAPLVERLDMAQLNDYISNALDMVRTRKN